LPHDARHRRASPLSEVPLCPTVSPRHARAKLAAVRRHRPDADHTDLRRVLTFTSTLRYVEELLRTQPALIVQ
jgi:hypothetical protein